MQSSNMGQKSILSAMVTFCILMYTPMGWRPTAFIASTTKGYYHSLPARRFSVSPVIRRAAHWWNPSSTLSISPITTQILLPYKSTNYATTLYIDTRARTVAPALSSTLATIPHRLQSVRRFW